VCEVGIVKIPDDDASVKFLQWCLPKLNYRWQGFRKVRKQVAKRITHRLYELELNSYAEYSDYLETHNHEWKILDSLCYITISRFYRDRKIFDALQSQLLPQIADAAIMRGNNLIQCWSAGSCSGEEPYSINIMWKLGVLPNLQNDIQLNILATEKRAHLIKRANEAVYKESSLRDMPKELISQVFLKNNNEYKLKEEFKAGVKFAKQNIREQMPQSKFDIVLCRNLVFTYFKEEIQSIILSKITDRIKQNGFLIIGAHESLPNNDYRLKPFEDNKYIYQKLN